LAKILKYSPLRSKLSKHAHIQLIFGTDAGRVETNDEWMTNSFFEEINAILPKGIDVDDDLPAWYDKPGLNLVLHGADLAQESEFNEVGLAYVSIYLNLIKGFIIKIETEGTD